MRRGFSLIELPIVIAIILVIVTVGVPAYDRAHMFAREMAATKAIQTIQAAEVQYQSQYGRYAASLRELGPPDTGASSAAAAVLISGTLASAAPVAYKSSGTRSFYSDPGMILRVIDGPEPATAVSPEYK